MAPPGGHASRGVTFSPPSPGSPAAYGGGGGGVPAASVSAAQRRQADILSQQASLINEQSNIIQQQTQIIEQQLGLMSALRGRSGYEQDGPLHQDPQQGIAEPTAGAAPYGSVYFAVDYHDANQMPRNNWMRRM